MREVRFDGRVAIVTGAGRGIGRDYALLLAARGAKVVVNDLGGAMDGTGEDAQPARSVADEINRSGGSAVANTASVADRAGAASIVKRALENFGRLDIVINNAGIAVDPFAPFETYPDDYLDRVLDVHLKGTWRVTQEAWPHMRRQGYGRVVNITSTAGLFGMPNNASYCAAKGAIYGLTRSLALQGAQHGINVNALAPGGFSRMVEAADNPRFTAWAAVHMKASLVAPGACWLAHEDCTENGKVFACAAGRMAACFMGESLGFRTNLDDFTLEAVRDNWENVAALEPFGLPDSVAGEMTLVNELLGKGQADRLGVKKIFGTGSQG